MDRFSYYVFEATSLAHHAGPFALAAEAELSRFVRQLREAIGSGSNIDQLTGNDVSVHFSIATNRPKRDIDDAVKVCVDRLGLAFRSLGD